MQHEICAKCGDRERRNIVECDACDAQAPTGTEGWAYVQVSFVLTNKKVAIDLCPACLASRPLGVAL
jgi:hypothetical protein